MKSSNRKPRKRIVRIVPRRPDTRIEFIKCSNKPNTERRFFTIEK